VTELAYLVAAAAFIVGLKQLSHPRTARRGNMLAAAGMLLAIVVTLIAQDIVSWGVVIAGLVIGGAIGAVWARKVADDRDARDGRRPERLRRHRVRPRGGAPSSSRSVTRPRSGSTSS
jgi:hypothetical protein